MMASLLPIFQEGYSLQPIHSCKYVLQGTATCKLDECDGQNDAAIDKAIVASDELYEALCKLLPIGSGIWEGLRLCDPKSVR